VTWTDHVEAWSHPPVDDVGYISSAEMLLWDDLKLMSTIRDLAQTRYGGWRNHNGLWREMLKLDDTHGKDVLDFGCGTGVESLELHRAGNRVELADISANNLALAMRVLSLSDRPPDAVTCHLVTDESPYLLADRQSFDVIHCAGVLHHIPWATEIMFRFRQLLRPGGEVRLMLYSDVGWKIATGDVQRPFWGADVRVLPGFKEFVRYFDGVGEYADWYDLNKIKLKFGAWFNVEEFGYITEDYRYCVAVLSRKGLS
jgi:SAM-dependent methyltransferase